MFRGYKPNRKRTNFIIYITAVLGVILTFVAYLLINENEKEHLKFEFEKEVEPIISSIQYSLEEVIADVDQIVRFFESSTEVTRAQFKYFTERLIARKTSILALEWIPLVKHSEKELYETSAQKDGVDGFRFKEVVNGKRVSVSKRQTYFPVYYFEPYKENESAAGFDLGSNSTRLKALNRSRDSGLPVAIARIHLIQENEKKYNFMVLAPVYIKGKPIKTLSERRRNLRGFAVGIFRVDNLVTTVLGQHGEEKLVIQLLDLSASEDQRILYKNYFSNSPVIYSINKTFIFAGRRLSIKCSVTERDFNSYYSLFRTSHLAIGIGIIITVLVLLLLYKIFNKMESETKKKMSEVYEQQRAIMASMPALAYMKDSSLKYIVANEAFYKSLKTDSKEIAGKSDFDFFPEVEANDFSEEDQIIIKSGKPLLNHEEYQTNASGDRRFVLTTKISIRNSSGDIVGLVGTTLDISDRKKAEDDLLKKSIELEYSNKELESFAYVASHDLKAPLRAIDNLASWISDDLEDLMEDETKEHITLLRSRVERMDNLLNSLLAYSRVGRADAEISAVDINALIEEIVSMTNPPEGVSINTTMTMPTLNTFKAPLQQVFMNLIGNAVKHRNEQDINIEIFCEYNDGFYKFTVKDDGPGIPVEHQAKAFELFQTLRPRDEVEGSGMGLAIVKKTVENNGGIITIDSGEGPGVSFSFTWPKNIK